MKIGLQLLRIIVKYVNMMDFRNILLMNRETFYGLRDIYDNRMNEFQFYLITKDHKKYEILINNIISQFGDDLLTFDINNDEIMVSKINHIMCIKLDYGMFQYYRCNKKYYFKLNIFSMDQIAKNLEIYDQLNIYKKINENKIHVYVFNKFNHKSRIHYTINL